MVQVVTSHRSPGRRGGRDPARRGACRPAASAVDTLALWPGGGDAPLEIETLGRRRRDPAALVPAWPDAARHASVVVGHGSATLPVRRGGVHASTRTPFVYRSIGDPAYWATSAARRARVRLAMPRGPASSWPSGRARPTCSCGSTACRPRPGRGDPERRAGRRLHADPARRAARGPAPRWRRRSASTSTPTDPLVAYLGALSAREGSGAGRRRDGDGWPTAQLVVAGGGPLADELRRPGRGGWAPGRVHVVGPLAEPAAVAGGRRRCSCCRAAARASRRSRSRPGWPACPWWPPPSAASPRWWSTATTGRLVDDRRPEAMAEALRDGRSTRPWARRWDGPPASGAWPGSALDVVAAAWEPLLRAGRGYGRADAPPTRDPAPAAPPTMARRSVKHAAELADLVRRPPAGIVVLIYHRVGRRSSIEVDLPEALFDEQMAALAESRSGRHPRRTPSTCWPRRRRRRRCRTARPGGRDLRRRHPRPGRGGGPHPGPLRHPGDPLRGHRLRRPGPRLPRRRAWPLSWAELRDLSAGGLWQLGSHTHTHALLDRLAGPQVDDELDRSIERIGDRDRHRGRRTSPTPRRWPRAPRPSGRCVGGSARRRWPAPGRTSTATPTRGGWPARRCRSATACAGSSASWRAAWALEDSLRRVVNRRALRRRRRPDPATVSPTRRAMRTSSITRSWSVSSSELPLGQAQALVEDVLRHGATDRSSNPAEQRLEVQRLPRRTGLDVVRPRAAAEVLAGASRRVRVDLGDRQPVDRLAVRRRRA